MQSPDFWSDPERAQKIALYAKSIRLHLGLINAVRSGIEDATVLCALGTQENDTATLEEADLTLAEAERSLDRLETQTFLSGKHDHRSCYLSIYAGTGGKEACDMASTLLRMYLRYCANAGYDVEEESINSVEGGGIKDVTLHVAGSYAFGYLNCERGTHRFTRVSPYNAQGKRQTSFCTVDVVPELEEAEVKLNDNELEIEFFVRARGPGGQHVNKTASACRIVHKPTKIMVVCAAERKQFQNKKRAMVILQAKLERLEEERCEIERLGKGRLPTGWGTQIRNYSLCENWVKDTRTGFGIPNPQRVLDGDIQGFIDAELRRRKLANK
jgi:peptide chain release factor 2